MLRGDEVKLLAVAEVRGLDEAEVWKIFILVCETVIKSSRIAEGEISAYNILVLDDFNSVKFNRENGVCKYFRWKTLDERRTKQK